MAGLTITAGAPAIPIRPGQKLRLIAIDPLTGNTVTGVGLSEWAIYGDDEGEGAPEPEQPLEWLSLDGGE
jgi:hypothetical protein